MRRRDRRRLCGRRRLLRFFRRLHCFPGDRLYRVLLVAAVLENIDAQDDDHGNSEDGPSDLASLNSQPVKEGLFRARPASLLLLGRGLRCRHRFFNIFCVSRQDRTGINPQKTCIGLDEGLRVHGFRHVLETTVLDGLQKRQPNPVSSGDIFQPNAFGFPDAFQPLEKLVYLQLRFLHGFCLYASRVCEFYLVVSPICGPCNRKCPARGPGRRQFFSSHERPIAIR